jgi:uncharacterized protein YktB (UPF0637 family)
MVIVPFTAKDFQIFDIPGFAQRMGAIRDEVRPKLEALGTALAPAVGRLVREELFPHVARHARRTVNPPDDTWVAFGPDRRGYKKAAHFKIAVSRHCLRLLFEIGPEHGAKPAFARAWKREAPRLGRKLARGDGLAWFRSEHDEEPAATLADLHAGGWAALAEALTRTRDGQLVLGRRVESREAATWRAADYEQAALDTFGALGDCFRLS